MYFGLCIVAVATTSSKGFTGLITVQLADVQLRLKQPGYFYSDAESFLCL